MAEPKKDTVEISLPATPGPAGSAPKVANPNTAPVVSPTRIPMMPIRRLPPKITPHLAEATSETASLTPSGASPILQPMPKPPGKPEGARSSIAPPVDRGPKKETARINLPQTQPLLVQPAVTPPAAPVVITSRPIVPPETISRPLCWALAGISAAIFLIQIWNYVVS